MSNSLDQDQAQQVVSLIGVQTVCNFGYQCRKLVGQELKNDFVFRSLDWEILPEEEGEEYTYTVQVTKQPSPKKRPMSPLKATMQERVTKETTLRPPCTPPRKEVIEVTSSEDVGSSTDTTSPHEQFAKGR